MADYQEMTNPELIAALRGLETQVAALSSIAAQSDRLSQELSIHQVELEAQNRVLHQAQREAEESRDHYADQYDSAPVGYVTLDAGGHIQDLNLTGAKTLGVERSHLIGVPFSLYVARSDVEAFREHLRQAGKSREPVIAELQLVVKEAQAIHVLLVSLALREGKEGISRYSITMTDVTAFRRAERVARTSALLLAKIFASLDHAVLVIDSSTHVVVNCNAAVAPVFGYGLNEMIGKTAEVLHVDPAASEAFLQRLARALEAQGVYHTAAAMRRKDGSIFPAEITVTEIRNDAGSRAGLVILVLDISERQQAEQALRENEDRFRAIFEQAAVGVSECVSETGGYARVNRKYCDIAGYARDELLARTFQEITHPADLEAERKLMQQLMRGEIRTFSMEKRLCRKDGGNVWVNQTVSPLWASGEGPSHHIAIIEDITERRHAIEDTKLRLAELEPVRDISTALPRRPHPRRDDPDVVGLNASSATRDAGKHLVVRQCRGRAPFGCLTWRDGE